MAVTPSYLSKTELVRTFFNKGTEGDKFRGDLHVWVRLLLPGVVKRIYNLQSKQVIVLGPSFGKFSSLRLNPGQCLD